MKTRLNSYFGGRISLPEFSEKIERLDDLAIKLFGSDTVSQERGNRSFFSRSFGYSHTHDKDTEAKLELNASSFEPCIAISENSVGYGIELDLVGTPEGVKNGFSSAIDYLGFPLRVEPIVVPMPFVNEFFAKLAGLEEYTNHSGWKVASQVISEKGAKLKKMSRSICRFPYNLFLRDPEGKVILNGKVLDPKWDIYGIETAKEFGQIGSVARIK